MTAHGGETEDPGELEDLQMILIVAHDADEKVMADAMLKEAEPFEGRIRSPGVTIELRRK